MGKSSHWLVGGRPPLRELQFLRFPRPFPSVQSHCLLTTIARGDELLVASELQVMLIAPLRSSFQHGVLSATQLSFAGLPTDADEPHMFISSITEVPSDDPEKSSTIAIAVARDDPQDSQAVQGGAVFLCGDGLEAGATAEAMAERGERVEVGCAPGLLQVVTVSSGPWEALRHVLLVCGSDEQV